MTTISLPQPGRGIRRRALVLLGGAALLLAGLGARTWLPSDNPPPAATAPTAAAPRFELPPQPAESVVTLATTPAQSQAPWERTLREARHPEP